MRAEWIDSLHGSEERITVPPTFEREYTSMSPSGEAQIVSAHADAPQSPFTASTASPHVDVRVPSPGRRTKPPERMSHPESWTTAEVINVIEETPTLEPAEVKAVVETAANIDLHGAMSHPESWTTTEVIDVIVATLTLESAEVSAVVEC